MILTEKMPKLRTKVDLNRPL